MKAEYIRERNLRRSGHRPLLSQSPERLNKGKTMKFDLVRCGAEKLGGGMIGVAPLGNPLRVRAVTTHPLQQKR